MVKTTGFKTLEDNIRTPASKAQIIYREFIHYS
jgi:hypothetical protein